LLSTPVGITGVFLENGIHAAADLAASAVCLTSAATMGIDGQIRNALGGVNALLEAGRTLTDAALIDGILTAVQGIVSAPVTAALAGIDRLSATIARAATITLTRLGDSTSTAWRSS